MIVTIVSDVLGAANNGTTIACLNLVHSLKAKGHEVRIVCPDADKKGTLNYFVVPTISFGPFDSIVEANGVVLAKGDPLILMRAIKDADEVHIMMPFILGRKAVEVAKFLHKPVSAGFHVQAENVTAHFFFFIHWGWLNHLVYVNFYKRFYRKIDAVHYPTQFIRDVFERECGHKTNGYVISNGVSKEFRKRDIVRPKELEGKFIIICTGRYSKEKNQAVLIEAVGKSKYNKDIQIILAGEGPRHNELKRLSDKVLAIPCMFRFYSRSELVDALSICDLYVHSSDVEIEAISCLEAISTGLVPLINDSPLSATRYFGLGENNLFKRNSATSLCEKIEYWIEHPEEKAECAKEYAGFSKQFDFDYCMEQMEKMIIETAKKGVKANEGTKEALLS